MFLLCNTLPVRLATLPRLHPTARAARGAMALSKLSGDQHRGIFSQLCNVLDPGLAVALSSASNELRTATQALLQQLRADHEAAAALCRKVGLLSCKELREAKKVHWGNKGLFSADLALLGTLGSVLPALERLVIIKPAAGPDGGQRLAAGLGAGALPAVTDLYLTRMHVGDAGASALAAALGRGALPRLEILGLVNAGISDAGLVALAPALRRLPALKRLELQCNPFSDEGLAALLAPPPAGALPPTTGVLTKLKELDLRSTQVTDVGWDALAAALDSGALPRLKTLCLDTAGIGDTGLVALAPALRRLPAQETLYLERNPFGDEGIAALVAPAGAPPTAVLPKLKELRLSSTQITDAGCAALAAALDSGSLPALEKLELYSIPASAAAIASVYEARANLKDGESESEHEESGSESEEDEEGEDDSEDGEYDD
eukprot:scaffold14149_cov66-Phaeocystis_antarctica.AAC.3